MLEQKLHRLVYCLNSFVNEFNVLVHSFPMNFSYEHFSYEWNPRHLLLSVGSRI